MVKSEHKRQQKLARKQVKTRKRHQQEVQKRQQLASVHGQMLSSAVGSIVYCGMSPQTQGMMTVLFARRAPGGLIAMMYLVVDTYCLGVKNVAGGIVDAEKLRDANERARTSPCEPALARGLVESAIEFAGRAGLHPYAEYRNFQPLWGDVARGSIEGLYEFGKDGKHLYVNGPFDDHVKRSLILNTLNENLGAGNFNTVLILGGLPGGASYELDEDDEELGSLAEPEAAATAQNIEYRRIGMGNEAP